jgi:hypothetical protein
MMANSIEMVWRDQDPPVVDVLLDFTVPFSGGGTPAYLEMRLAAGWAFPGNCRDTV